MIEDQLKKDYVNRDGNKHLRNYDKLEDFLKMFVAAVGFTFSICVIAIIVSLFSSKAEAKETDYYSDYTLKELCFSIGYMQQSTNSVSSYELALYTEMYKRSPLGTVKDRECSLSRKNGSEEYKKDYEEEYNNYW